ncbi:MAG: hypothetical protein M5U29_05665 [Anaerolineae bacterium]|nr:hypothetical protein [Anaerolineae bacterium]
MEVAAEALDSSGRPSCATDRSWAQILAPAGLVADIDADQDVIAFAQEGSDAVVQMFLIRNGRLVGSGVLRPGRL